MYRLCLKSQTSRLDRVSTTCGSGWVRRRRARYKLSLTELVFARLYETALEEVDGHRRHFRTYAMGTVGEQLDLEFFF